MLNVLRQQPLFADQPAEQLEWFAAQSRELVAQKGDIIAQEGDAAADLVIVVEGQISAQRESDGPDAPMFIVNTGEVGGRLPFSRLRTYQVAIRALTSPTRLLLFSADLFPEMLQRLPVLGERLVGIMSDRIRRVTRMDLQRDKLLALGRISAGLAHELNNPAAAALRSADGLRHARADTRAASQRLDRLNLSVPQREAIWEWEREALGTAAQAQSLDTLTQSDRTDAIGRWLSQQRIPGGWQYSAALAEAGVTPEQLAALAAQVPAAGLGDVFVRVTASLTEDRLLRELDEGIGRIAKLVGVVKEYSYLDQAPLQEIDIHDGLENTLTMLEWRWKGGVEVVREYDRTLPRLIVRGAELTQVWTNLIENALDAMQNQGVLTVRTSLEARYVVVEILDNGPGISAEIKERVFDPFFTTKQVGQGTGLGLDAVYQIVLQHHGNVRFESEPGRTCFQVRLPLPGSAA